MRYLHASHALLPDGWAESVRIGVRPDGAIESVTAGAPTTADAESLSAVIPGVPNAHSHAFQRGMVAVAERSASGRGSFWSWREVMYRFVATLSPDQVAAIASQLFVEMLEAGYTSVTEFHYLHHQPNGAPYDDPAEMALAVVGAARSTGIGVTMLPVVYDAGGVGGAPLLAEQRRFRMSVEGALDLGTRIGAASASDPDVSVGVALHSVRGASPEAQRELASVVSGAAPGDIAAAHVHAAEQPSEVEESVARYGARPVRWLLEGIGVDARWTLVHATHLDSEECHALAASGATVALCPSTEANLGDGLFPLASFLRSGGAIALGSDSHVTVDPAAEIQLLEYGQRLLSGARNVGGGPDGASTGETLLRSSLNGGAAAGGRSVGSLQPGYRADLVVLDAEHAALAVHPPDRWIDAWVFGPRPGIVQHVMAGGRWVVRDGRHADRDAVARRFVAALGQVALDRG